MQTINEYQIIAKISESANSIVTSLQSKIKNTKSKNEMILVYGYCYIISSVLWHKIPTVTSYLKAASNGMIIVRNMFF